jgi:DNA-3-methyladenine glycosylase II
MKKALTHLTQADPIMGAIIDKVGPYRIVYTEPIFQSLARSIVYQQLSGKAAATIFGRFVTAVGGEPLTPKKVLRLTFEEMRSIGLSSQKATYIRDLAGKTSARELVFEQFDTMSDEEVLAALTRVKGIGVWTAQMFLMFSLRRLDVLPCADLGIRNAVQKAYGLDEPVSIDQIKKIGERWRPYCTVASWYLWRSLEL